MLLESSTATVSQNSQERMIARLPWKMSNLTQWSWILPSKKKSSSTLKGLLQILTEKLNLSPT